MGNNKELSKVAVVGLGKVGSALIEKLSDLDGKALSIVAVAESDMDAPGVAVAKKLGIKLYNNEKELVEIADDIDIIFDLSGNSQVETWMRSALSMKANCRTAIASRNVAVLLWNILSEGLLPENDN